MSRWRTWARPTSVHRAKSRAIRVAGSWKYRILALLTLLLGLGRIQGQMPHGGLLAYFPMDGTGEERISGLHADVVGGVHPAEDRFGHPCGALRFNGVDGYLRVDGSTALSRPTTGLTIAAWYYLEPGQIDMRWLTLVCKGISPRETVSNPQYRFQAQQSAFSTVSINSEITEPANIVLPLARWVFVAFIYDGNELRMMQDGQLVFRFPYRKTLVKNSAPLEIGRDVPGSTEFFNGKLDDLVIYERALSEPELDQLQHALSARPVAQHAGLSLPTMPALSMGSAPDQCGNRVDYADPTPVVDCGRVQLSRVQGPSKGDFVAVGRHYVMFKVEDPHGRQALGGFPIRVVDDLPPVVQCPDDQTLVLEHDDAAPAVQWPDPRVEENCPGWNLYQIQGPSPGTPLTDGRHAIIYEAVDAHGGRSRCTFDIVVQRMPPSELVSTGSQAVVQPSDTESASRQSAQPSKVLLRHCPQDTTLYLPYGSTEMAFQYIAPKLQVVGGQEWPLERQRGSASGEVLTAGQHVFFFRSGQGNEMATSAQCLFTVEVVEAPEPIVSCPGDTIVQLRKGQSDLVYAFPAPGLQIGDASYAMKQIAGPGVGTRLGQGRHVFRFAGVPHDTQWNDRTCTFQVIVLDENEGSVSCPGDTVLMLEEGQDSLPFVYPMPSVIWEGLSHPLDRVRGALSGEFLEAGKHVYFFQSNQLHDNRTGKQCLFTVELVRSRPPQLRCPPDMKAYAQTGTDGTIVVYGEPVALSESGTIPVHRILGPPSASRFPLGTTEVAYRAETPAGSTEECRFTVTVSREEAPERMDNLRDLGIVGADKVSYEKYLPLHFDSCKLHLYAYDHKKYDHDTVSIIFNRNIKIHREEVRRKEGGSYRGAIPLILELAPGVPNYLILKAWNEGDIPPNTLQVDIFYSEANKGADATPMPVAKQVLEARPGEATGLILQCPQQP